MKYFYKIIRPWVIEMLAPKDTDTSEFIEWLEKKLSEGYKVRIRTNTVPERKFIIPIAQIFHKRTFFSTSKYKNMWTFEKDEYIPTKVEEVFEKLKQELSENSLFEEVSAKVFHITHPSRVINILKTNKFELSKSETPNSSNSVNVNLKKYSYYMSTARNMQSDFIKTSMDYSINPTVLELDGKKLSQNYKAKPHDFFSRPFYNKEKKKFSQNKMTSSHEAEDRIYSQKKTIPNARKYIKAIHVGDKEENMSEKTKKLLKSLKENSGGIPVYFYKEMKDFRLLKKQRAIEI